MNPEIFKEGDFKYAVNEQIKLCMQDSTDLAAEAALLSRIDVRAKLLQIHARHASAILQIFKKEVMRELRATSVKGVTRL
jgi:hypothetical protein|tara:strand:+ start:1080 stop:1319 length:240 start_codon:yes stop_codon:yes gene_type:complete